MARGHLFELIVLEEGKPYAEALGEVGYAASFLEWTADLTLVQFLS